MIRNPKQYKDIFKEAIFYLFPNLVGRRTLFFDTITKSENLPLNMTPYNYRDENQTRDINLTIYRQCNTKFYIIGEILEKNDSMLVSLEAFLKSHPKREVVSPFSDKELARTTASKLSLISDRLGRIEYSISTFNFEFRSFLENVSKMNSEFSMIERNLPVEMPLEIEVGSNDGALDV